MAQRPPEQYATRWREQETAMRKVPQNTILRYEPRCALRDAAAAHRNIRRQPRTRKFPAPPFAQVAAAATPPARLLPTYAMVLAQVRLMSPTI
jgi:hypothetical protein